MSFLHKRFLDNTVESYLIAIGIIIAAFVLASVVKKLSESKLRAWAQSTETQLDDIIISLIQWPLYWLVRIIGLYMAIIALKIPQWFASLTYSLMILSSSIVVAMTLSRFVDLFFQNYISKLADRTESRLDDQLLPVLQRSLKASVWVLAILLVLDNFGYDVTALITGLGLGGLALAMAAKDTLSNVLGGVTIFLDQPFRINDIVTVSGTTGTVEEVGLRTTRVRTFDGHLVTIPNGHAANSVIENISERPKVRVRFNLGLTYDTPLEKCKEAVDIVCGLIKGTEGVVEEPSVFFLDFQDSSIGFQVTYYIDKTASVFGVRHAINMQLKDALAKAEIDMAFPTVTIDAPPEMFEMKRAA